MERRYKLFAENNVRDIKSYTKLAKQHPDVLEHQMCIRDRLMHNTGELVMDMGTVLGGEQAVEEGLIDAIGNLGDALRYLYAEIDAGKTGY